MIGKKLSFSVSAVWFLFLAAFFASCTIVRHDSSGTSAVSNGEFDASAFVEQNWSTKIIPEMTANAVDLKDVLGALKSDPDGAHKRWGKQADESAPFNYVVRGEAKVNAVNTESAAATIGLAIPNPLSGKVQVQIGPVIKTSAVRDVLSFIHFGDFTNQVDFANVSRAINLKVKTTVLGALDRAGLLGKTVRFVGAFAEDPSGNVLITPVVFEVEK